MNPLHSSTYPLPSALDAISFSLPHRRRAIGNFRLNSRDLERFNGLLARLGRTQAPLACDQLATAARELTATAADSAAPACILQRLKWAETAAQMVADRGWEPANEALEPTQLILGYVRDHEDLIPDWLPQVGRLDDAIVIDTAWPELASEVDRYVDFRRLRHVEAALRGCADAEFRFTRADWEQARHAEAALRAHRRSVRGGSYVPSPAPLFRIH
jgi:uncharacterized membrane protein YkvA (DUF1232 family)